MPSDSELNNNADSEIFTIPEEFYGAAKREPPSLSQMGAFAPARAVPGVNRPAVAAASARLSIQRSGLDWRSPKFIIISLAVLLIIIVGGFAFYYIRQAQRIKKNLTQISSPTAPALEALEIIKSPAGPTSPILEETSTEATSTPPTATITSTPIFPFKDYTKALDTDNDGLTDIEESLYETDPQKPDYDADGYLDGLEVRNLYNPLGFKPVRLISSGQVKIYLNPSYNYSIYYPRQWIAQSLDAKNEEIMFSSDTGEFIEARVEDNALKLPVKDWYLAQSPGVKAGDLKMIKIKEEIEGILSPDGLTVYLPFEDRIFLINYNIGLKTEVNFLTTLEMMINSFKVKGDLEEIKEGETATSTIIAPLQP